MTGFTDTEVWRSVESFEGYYEVSSHGRVRSLDRIDNYGRLRKGQILALTENRHGHQYVKLTRANRKLKQYVHRLVLGAFVGVCPPSKEGCHNDGNPRNNHITNLRWDTHAANIQDTILHGHHPPTVQAMCRRGHPLRDPNLATWAKKGHRRCKACARANDRVGHSGRTDLDVEADIAFREIWGEARNA